MSARALIQAALESHALTSKCFWPLCSPVSKKKMQNGWWGGKMITQISISRHTSKAFLKVK